MTESSRKLLYQHEVLRAKLELKNHLLQSVVRDIYEQTGQVLSLARFRLATVEDQVSESVRAEIADAGNLVGEAITSLRKLSRNLFPEQEILTDSGFIKALQEELQMDLPGNPKILEVSGSPSSLAAEPGVMLLAIILSLVALIKKLAVENTLGLKIFYTKTYLLISITYNGKPIDIGTIGNLDESDLTASLNIQQRLRLIQGSITSKPAPNNCVGYQIKVPL